MTEWECVAGGTLLIPSGPTDHLHIILNDPCIFDGYVHEQCILVGISSVGDAPYDDTCVLEAEDHDYIKHTSYAYYRKARLDEVTHLKAMVSSNNFRPHNSASNELLDKLNTGLYTSKQTKKYIKELKSS